MNARKSLYWIIPFLILSVGIELFLLQTTTQFGGYIFGTALKYADGISVIRLPVRSASLDRN